MKLFSKLHAKIRDENIKKTFLQFSTLSTGNLITVFITLLSYPLLSRLYTAYEFGEFALFQSILIVILPLATLNYQEAIVIIQRKERLKKLISLLVHMTLIFTCLLTLFVGFSGFQLIGISLTAKVLWMLPITLLMASIIQISNFVLLNKEKFKVLSIIKVIERVGFNGTAVLLSLVKGAVNGLVLGLLSGQLMALSIILYQRVISLKFSKPTKLEKAILKKYNSFALYALPGGFLERLSRYLPIILLSTMINEAVTGQYAMAYKILSLPEIIAGTSLGNIFYLQANKRYVNKQKVSPLILKTWVSSISIALIPMVIMLFWGPEIFIFTLSNKWQQSGFIASIIAPMMFVLFLTSPVSYWLNVFNKQDVDLKMGIATLISRLLTLSIGLKYLGLYDAIKLFVTLEVCILIIYNIYIIKLALKWERTLS